MQHYTTGYNFYGFYAKISHEAGSNNRFYLSIYGGDDRLGTNFNDKYSHAKGYSKYLWGNILTTARWNHVYNLYNRQNTVFYFYDHKDQDKSKEIALYKQSGFPIIPTVKYSIRF